MVLQPHRRAIPAVCDPFSVCGETMSTSVYNPFTFNEVSRIRASNVGRRPPVDTNALARVKRDLFGPVNHEDTRKFVMRELAAQQSLAASRWGFDFEREEPVKDGPGSERYFWKKVTKDDYVSKAYDHGEYHMISSEMITASAEDVCVVAPTPPASPLDAASSTCQLSPLDIETAQPTVPALQAPSVSSIKRTPSLKSSMKRRRINEVKLQQKKITDFLRIRKLTSVDSSKVAKLRRLSAGVAASSDSHLSS